MIRQKILKNPCYAYHFAWSIIGIICGVGGLYYLSILDLGVSLGIMVGTFGLVLGTLLFGLLPMTFIFTASFVKYIMVLALPAYLVQIIGKMAGESNLIDHYGYLNLFVISTMLSLFGLFNIITARKASKETGDWLFTFPFHKI